MKFKDITSKLSAFFKSNTGRLVIKWAQRLFFVGILAYLVFELSKIGWLEVWEALPLVPAFYLLYLLSYFQLPLAEVWIYRITWVFDALRSIPVFIIKRVYNKDVLGYSGELYFYAWAQNHINLSAKEIATTIKDNNVISSIASTLVSVGLLSIFVFSGQVKLSDWFSYEKTTYWILGVFLAILIIVVLIRFRNYVIHMAWSKAFSIFGIQMLRLIVVQALNLLMFYAVMPDTALYVWFTYLSIEIILSRIPFIPNKDFVFVSLSIGMAGTLQVNESEIAALMLTRSVLGKIMNFGFFGLFNIYKPKVEEINPTKQADFAD